MKPNKNIEVRMHDYKLRFINEDKEVMAPLKNQIQSRYFKADTMHDHTSKGTPNDDKLIEDALNEYPDRANEMKFMLIEKSDYKKIKENGSTEINVKPIENGILQPEMDFKKYIETVLKIDLQEEILSNDNRLQTCESHHRKKSIYEYMRFINIYDMGPQFPDKLPSPSYIIDSASSTNKIDEVPNICKKIENSKYNINGYIMPGVDSFNDETNQNYSLLFFGDLQIAHYFFKHFGLDSTPAAAADADKHIIKIGKDLKDLFHVPTDPLDIDRLIQLSVISLNIFWQYVLSYVKLYTDIDNTESNCAKAIKYLRHWVFLEVDVQDSKKIIYRGKFVKGLNSSLSNVYKIAYWFLTNHDKYKDDETEFEKGDTNDENTKNYELDITQKRCAKMINKVATKLNLSEIATEREGDDKESGITKAIEEFFIYGNTKGNTKGDYIIQMLQILKFTGDKSHQTISELLQVVFKQNELFQKMTTCVNTLDRPLIAGCIMDNRPFIIPITSSEILKCFGLTNSKPTNSECRIVTFYIPKSEMNIIDKINQQLSIVGKYINMLMELYAKDVNGKEIYDIFTINSSIRKNAKINIIDKIYEYIGYILLLLLSLFTLVPSPTSKEYNGAEIALKILKNEDIDINNHGYKSVNFDNYSIIGSIVSTPYSIGELTEICIIYTEISNIDLKKPKEAITSLIKNYKIYVKSVKIKNLVEIFVGKILYSVKNINYNTLTIDNYPYIDNKIEQPSDTLLYFCKLYLKQKRFQDNIYSDDYNIFKLKHASSVPPHVVSDVYLLEKDNHNHEGLFKKGKSPVRKLVITKLENCDSELTISDEFKKYNDDFDKYNNKENTEILKNIHKDYPLLSMVFENIKEYISDILYLMDKSLKENKNIEYIEKVNEILEQSVFEKVFTICLNFFSHKKGEESLLGLFTIKPSKGITNSNKGTRSQPKDDEELKKALIEIDGIYCLFNNNLQKSYSDLKDKFKNLLNMLSNASFSVSKSFNISVELN